MCPDGYKSIEHNATCESETKIVSVKLIPINGASSDDIRLRTKKVEPEAPEVKPIEENTPQPNPAPSDSIIKNTSSGSFGYLGLILCVFIGVWRRAVRH
ncbi:hypothetical protein [Vibrio sonorensis]|uniref:hypothetical protein n=1 Tax=Vibrio sonorensis TaxID=1004316 RepID=UPI0008D909D8|nr:hypothetical protein [Vibrio sonorensis]